MHIVAWALSDTGRKRDHNEDSVLLSPDLGLYGVADGMGGHAAGDRASQLAVETVDAALRAVNLDEAPQGTPSLQDAPGKHLADAVRRASQVIYEESARDVTRRGMGTTLTTIVLRGGRLYLAHVGDSRCYLFRDGRIEQLTVDHSWIEEQVRAGFMTREEAEESALKHVVTRSVGFESEVEVDLMAMPVLTGDCYLLCSDGLSNYLTERQLTGFLTRGYYSEVPKRLVDTANALGGDDNISVVVVYVANERQVPEGAGKADVKDNDAKADDVVDG